MNLQSEKCCLEKVRIELVNLMFEFHLFFFFLFLKTEKLRMCLGIYFIIIFYFVDMFILIILNYENVISFSFVSCFQEFTRLKKPP